jgi:metal-responsive CopG/Arc/MetJ family transcriptional regulator
MSRQLDPTGEPPVAITFHVTQDVAADLAEMVKIQNKARSEIVRKMVDRGIKEYRRGR